MSNDNDGLYATAEAFVYVAMTRPMVFFQAFHVAIAVEMLLAASTTWGFVLGKSISESRRADSNRLPLLITSLLAAILMRTTTCRYVAYQSRTLGRGSVAHPTAYRVGTNPVRSTVAVRRSI
jgi:hypothetical protein